MPRLRARNTKYPYNDWNESPKDLDKFEEELRETILRKFGVDHDGDCPVNLQLIDRTKFQASNYLPVPYGYEAKKQEDFLKIYQVLSLNLSTALREMDNFVRNMHDRLGMVTFTIENQDKISS